MCALFLYCDLRFGYIANLHYSDIDLANNRIFIRDPKNQTAKIVYMPETVKEFMSTKKAIANDDLIYKNKLQTQYKMTRACQVFCANL
jgi:integrase